MVRSRERRLDRLIFQAIARSIAQSPNGAIGHMIGRSIVHLLVGNVESFCLDRPIANRMIHVPPSKTCEHMYFVVENRH